MAEMDNRYNDYTEKIGQWKTAVGLQAVDGLQPSDYLYSLAGKHIEGQIGITEVQELLDTYYQQKESRDAGRNTDEADKVAANIVQVLADNHFSLCADEYRSIHESLFYNVFSHAGMYRLKNIAKKEWVLKQASVEYGDYRSIEYDLKKAIQKEADFDYSNLHNTDKIRHFADFIANIWQIHPFFEGNTRTTAVFAIKYLKEKEFDVDNEIFRKHSFFFRNALVRACYENPAENISKDSSYLYQFFENLILKTSHKLQNRNMLILPPDNWSHQDSKEKENKIDKKRLTNIGIYKHNNDIYSIKCFIDDREQIGKHLKIKDLMEYYKIKETASEEEKEKFLLDLAERYFKDALVIDNKKEIHHKR